VTGYDAWVIASKLHLSMEQFLVFVPEQAKTATGFQLDRTETTYIIALNKQPSPRKKPCIFLLTLPNGYDRCSIYPHRPLICQTFPTLLRHGSVAIREDLICPKGAWNVASMDLPTWRLSLLRMEMESAVYRLVVCRWNECVEKEPADASYSIFQYFAYLMNAYSRLEMLRRDIPEEEITLIIRTWGQAATEEGQRPWQGFLVRAQEALAEFANALAVSAI
jgi:Fe-S-cluster containining protein